MPFIAECLFCKGKVRVPDSADGWSIECPRCGNSFTVTPMRNPPKDLATPAPTIAPRPIVRPELVGASMAGPDEKLPPSADLRSLAANAESSVRPAPWPQHGPRKRSVNYPGLFAFLLGSFAVLFVSIPSLRLLSLPLSALGLLLALFGLAAVDTLKSGYLFPGVGLALNVPILLYALLGLGLFSRAPRAEAEAQAASGKQAIVPVGSHTGDAPTPASEAEWIDVSQGALQQGDVRVRVTAVTVGPVEFKGTPRKHFSKEKYLQVSLRISNVGVVRKITYTSWAEANPGVLRAESGRACAGKTFGPGSEVAGHVRQATLAPGKFADDVLVFEPPSAPVEYLRLELPAAAFGASGTLHLHIPRSLIAFR